MLRGLAESHPLQVRYVQLSFIRIIKFIIFIVERQTKFEREKKGKHRDGGDAPLEYCLSKELQGQVSSATSTRIKKDSL
ncbi:hypothetical protein AMECASPLE_024564 [Ameca splendens]|uniref:Uncharacterized protein n=1 Tax=Ameca splendens TaxID=208324 RepID=A0ABV0XTJ2_9TELE